MKQKVLTILLALFASTVFTFAETYSGTCGENLTWTLKDGTLTISGTGMMKDYSHDHDCPWYSYSIKTAIIEDGVTTIGKSAFEGCSSLTTVTIGGGVTTIGKSAFDGCSSLTSVVWNAKKCNNFTSSNTPFYYKYDYKTYFDLRTQITSFTFGDNVEYIPAYLCAGMKNITSVTIPNSVTNVGDNAFKDCSGLTSVHISDLEAWCKIAFYCYDSYNNNPLSYANHLYMNGKEITDLEIPNSVTSISQFAFYGCSGLASVTIPNSVTTIGTCAFWYCSGLTSISIPNSVTTIGMQAFEYCSGLTSVTIPNSVTSIGLGAFGYCSGLISVIIPNSVTSIGYNTFGYCRNLTSVTIPNSVTTIDHDAFEGCSSLTSVTIGESVTTIGNGAFQYCSKLTSVVWNAKNCNNFTSSNTPFYYSTDYKTYFDLRTQITSFTFGDNVEYIPDYLCAYMTNLTSVTIPNSVTSIGESAFDNVPNIVYNGSATGSPWGARSVNGYVDGWLVYSDASKTELLACSSAVTDEITIPNSVTTIRDNAFYGCNNLPVIDNIRYADTYLVKAVNRTLSTYTIKEGTKWIGNGAFYNCSSLTSVTIPNSVTTIGNIAFKDCSSLKAVTMESKTPPSIGYEVFPSSTTIYVPLGSFNDYKASDWKNYNIRVFNLTAVKGKEYSTSAQITINASLNGDDKNKFIKACGVIKEEEGGEEEFSGNIAEFIGMEPGSEYNDMPFFIRTTAGDYDTIHVSFSTSALTLNTLESKAVSGNTAILLAETNMSEAEANCGFEWRRNDAPEDMASNQVVCPVANGQLAGRLKGLKDDVYYKYRAFYKSAEGKMYYGDWQYVFTGDATVEFDPVLYTYAPQSVSERKATLKGYALAGSDDFTEQGFEYWADSRNSSHAPRRAPQDAIGEKHTVAGSGISMQVTLDNLDEGTVYKYRTYAKVGGKTLYGSEMQFTTQGTYEEPIETDLEQVGYDNAGEDDRTPATEAPQARKYLRNSLLFIERNGITYTAQGQRLD